MIFGILATSYEYVIRFRKEIHDHDHPNDVRRTCRTDRTDRADRVDDDIESKIESDFGKFETDIQVTQENISSLLPRPSYCNKTRRNPKIQQIRQIEQIQQIGRKNHTPRQQSSINESTESSEDWAVGWSYAYEGDDDGY